VRLPPWGGVGLNNAKHFDPAPSDEGPYLTVHPTHVTTGCTNAILMDHDLSSPLRHADEPRTLGAGSAKSRTDPILHSSCGEHGYLCRRHLRLGPASGKRYLTPGATRVVDRLFDDVTDRLYCRRSCSFLESTLIDPLPIATEHQKRYPPT
jgi:hypothetical protein